MQPGTCECTDRRQDHQCRRGCDIVDSKLPQPGVGDQFDVVDDGKKTLEVAAKTVRLSGRRSRYMLKGGPPEWATKLVKPATDPASQPNDCGQFRGTASRSRYLLIQKCSAKETATMSMTQSIGNIMAAACNGDMTNAIKGTAATPRPPPKPPLEMPNSSTAGTATA